MYLFQSTIPFFLSSDCAKTKGNLCAAFSSHNEGGKRKRNLSAEKTGQLSYKSASFLFSLDPTLLSSEQEREKMKGVREVGRKIACLKRAQPRYSGCFLLGALLFFSRDRGWGVGTVLTMRQFWDLVLIIPSLSSPHLAPSLSHAHVKGKKTISAAWGKRRRRMRQ